MRRFILLVALPLILAACAGGAKTSVRIPWAARNTSLPDAFARLRALGLKVEVKSAFATPLRLSSLEIPAVDRLRPRAGTRVRVGSVVTIFAGGGPIASPVGPKSNPRYRVPDFVGRAPTTAMRWADDHGVYWAIRALSEPPPSSAPNLFAAYRVVAQRPAPGGSIERGKLVGGSGYQVTPLTLTLAVR